MILTRSIIWIACVSCERVHSVEALCLPHAERPEAVSFPCYHYLGNLYFLFGATQAELDFAEEFICERRRRSGLL